MFSPIINQTGSAVDSAGVLSNQDLQGNVQKVTDCIEKSLEHIEDTRRAVHMSIFSKVGGLVFYEENPGENVRPDAFIEPEMLRLKQKDKYESYKSVAERLMLELLRYVKDDVNLIRGTDLLAHLKGNASKSATQFIYVAHTLAEMTSRLKAVQARIREIGSLEEGMWKDEFFSQAHAELLSKTVNYYEMSFMYTNPFQDQFIGKKKLEYPTKKDKAWMRMMQERIQWHKRALKEKEESFSRLVEVFKNPDDLSVMDF